MTTMVERVARALAAEHDRIWAALPDNLKAGYRCDARHAIAAMREPTADMLVAMAGRDIYSAKYLATRKTEWLESDWQRAIDAALAPEEPKG